MIPNFENVPTGTLKIYNVEELKISRHDSPRTDILSQYYREI